MSLYFNCEKCERHIEFGTEKEHDCDFGTKIQKELETLRSQNEILLELLEGILSNVSLDWYVQNFYKQPDYSNGQTGIAAKIHNIETLERISIAFKRARDALEKVRGGKDE